MIFLLFIRNRPQPVVHLFRADVHVIQKASNTLLFFLQQDNQGFDGLFQGKAHSLGGKHRALAIMPVLDDLKRGVL